MSLTLDEALDKLLSEDEVLEIFADKDLGGYFELLCGKVIKDFTLDDVQFDDRPQFFVSTIQEIVTPQNIEQLKSMLGSVTYVYLSGLYNADTVILDSSFKYDYPFNIDPYLEVLNKGHITNMIMDAYEYYTQMLNYCVCENLTISNMKDADITVSGGSRTWDSITIDTPLESLRFDAAKKVIYTKNSLIQLSDNSLSLPQLKDPELKVEAIYLPNVPNIRLPRWLCNGDYEGIIYKTKGQKVGIYSMYKDWCKEHIKSI